MAADEKNESMEDGEAAPPPKKKSKMLIFIAAGVVLLLVGGGAGFYFLSGMFAPKKDDAKEAAAAKPKEISYLDLPDMLVNLNGPGRKTNFLKVTISLELDRKDDQPKIVEAQPRIIDTFQTYMRELRPEDLRGSAGLYRLREELLARVNLAVAPAQIDDVLFREMLVQ